MMWKRIGITNEWEAIKSKSTSRGGKNQLLPGRGGRIVGKIRMTETLGGSEAFIGVENEHGTQERYGVSGSGWEYIVEGEGGTIVPGETART